MPAYITNNGGPATIQLAVQGDDAVTLSRNELEIPAKKTVQITITPTAVSQSANDVKIVAMFEGEVVASQSMTVAQVSFQQQINAADTPDGMPDRIPPRVNFPVEVTVTPNLAESGESIMLQVGNQRSPKNGVATIDGNASIPVTSTGMHNILGTSQTAPATKGGKPGKLNLQAMINVGGVNRTIAKSAGFSIAAIPTGWTEQFNKPIRNEFLGKPFLPGVRYAGLQTAVSMTSDSGDPADLSGILVAEEIEVTSRTGRLNEPLNVMEKPVPPGQYIADTHVIASSYLNQDGTLSYNQVHIYYDPQLGVGTKFVIPDSGYQVTQTVAPSPTTTGVWVLTTTKTAMAVKAHGDESDAGGVMGGPLSNEISWRPR